LSGHTLIGACVCIGVRLYLDTTVFMCVCFPVGVIIVIIVCMHTGICDPLISSPVAKCVYFVTTRFSAYVYVHVCVCVCVCVYIYVCVYGCEFAYLGICMQTRTSTVLRIVYKEVC